VIRSRPSIAPCWCTGTPWNNGPGPASSGLRRLKDNPDQLLLELDDIGDAEELKAVRRQVSDNWRDGEQRLASIDSDLEREPERIRRTFALQTHRVEPAGAIDLWPQY
jgi:hypothetical protein